MLSSLWDILVLVWEYGYPVAESAFMIIGALKLISRYTPWKWDDRALAQLERPALWLSQFFSLFRKGK